MHDICFVNLPWSAKARLRKLFLQLPHLSVFSLIKRVFRDALKQNSTSLIFRCDVIFIAVLSDYNFSEFNHIVNVNSVVGNNICLTIVDILFSSKEEF